jgi:hypothetical protein
MRFDDSCCPLHKEKLLGNGYVGPLTQSHRVMLRNKAPVQVWSASRCWDRPLSEPNIVQKAGELGFDLERLSHLSLAEPLG